MELAAADELGRDLGPISGVRLRPGLVAVHRILQDIHLWLDGPSAAVPELIAQIHADNFEILVVVVDEAHKFRWLSPAGPRVESGPAVAISHDAVGGQREAGRAVIIRRMGA